MWCLHSDIVCVQCMMQFSASLHLHIDCWAFLVKMYMEALIPILWFLQDKIANLSRGLNYCVCFHNNSYLPFGHCQLFLFNQFWSQCLECRTVGTQEAERSADPDSQLPVLNSRLLEEVSVWSLTYPHGQTRLAIVTVLNCGLFCQPQTIPVGRSK